jgi:hypothetical protein
MRPNANMRTASDSAFPDARHFVLPLLFLLVSSVPNAAFSNID